jgi:hypothetical protein
VLGWFDCVSVDGVDGLWDGVLLVVPALLSCVDDGAGLEASGDAGRGATATGAFGLTSVVLLQAAAVNTRGTTSASRTLFMSDLLSG